MLQEHFIDPEFLIEAASVKRNYKDFLKEFGRQSPRVVGEIQKFRRFESKVLSSQSESASELAKGRLIEILNVIKEKCLVSRNLHFDGAKPYIENFVKAHQNVPANTFCLGSPYEPLYEEVQHIFKSQFEDGFDSLRNQLIVRKSIDEMTNAVKDFLRLSSEITFVDPYFSDKPRMLNPMLKFIETSAIGSPTKEKHIKILFKARQEAPSSSFLLDKIKEGIDLEKLKLNSIQVISLSEKEFEPREKLHNRYIITELGALIWGIGLDEATSEISDDVVLMDDELYDYRYSQYCDVLAFDVYDKSELKFD